MASHTAVATTTITDGWPVKVPNQPGHLNVGAGVDTPQLSSYIQAGVAGRTVELGGFDFSAIPEGSIIHGITIRQYTEAIAEDFDPGITFTVKIGGVDRQSKGFGVDTSGMAGVGVVAFDGIATRDELATPGSLSIKKVTQANDTDPPFPFFP